MRPLSFTVRFRMHRAPAVLLAFLVTAGSIPLAAQTETTVHVFVSAENCVIGNLELPCSDVGTKLLEWGTPLDAHIDLSFHSHTTYEAMRAALESLRRAGFNRKLGRVNVQPDGAVAQPKGVLITINSDGTCEAVGQRASCREIGAELQKAGIPSDTWIGFAGDTIGDDALFAATLDSLSHAGFKNVKIGFLTQPAR